MLSGAARRDAWRTHARLHAQLEKQSPNGTRHVVPGQQSASVAHIVNEQPASTRPPSRRPASTGRPPSTPPSHGPALVNAQPSEQRSRRVCPAPHPVAVRRVAPGTHSPSPVHALATQLHSAVHRSVVVPQRPHGAMRVVPGVHDPISTHVPYSHTRAAVQKRSTVPHDPHATLSTAPGVVHPSTMQGATSSSAQVAEQRSSCV